MSEIKLLVDDQVFQVQKSVLCEYSDYFRAMFSGNYVENDQEQITINMVDASSMTLILEYMKNGLIDLTQLPLSVMGELAISANFLQMTELLKQIEYTLTMQLSFSNWMTITDLAETSSFPKLETRAACFGLLQFKSMKTEHIPNIEKLFWFLSHPYLNNETELAVFQFGLQWICDNQLSANALLIILGCLEVSSITDQELQEMQILLKPYEHSLASKMIDCLQYVVIKTDSITISDIMKNKMDIMELYTERVYNETLQLVEQSVVRVLSLVACIPASRVDACKAECEAQFLYKLEDEGLKRWVEYPERNVWGWSMTGCIVEVVVAGGEYGRGSGVFHRDVLVLAPPSFLPPGGAAGGPGGWMRQGARLPPRRHAGLALHRDKLYIVGGVGQFRILLSSVLVYDFKDKTYRKLADFPDTIQNPPLCFHEDRLYVGAERAIYRLIEGDLSERWEIVLETSFRASCLLSFGKHVYVTQSYYSSLMRFRPDIDKQMTYCKNFAYPVVAMCNIGRSILAFTQETCGERVTAAVERFSRGDVTTLWTDAHSDIKFNEVSGCCAVMSPPPSLTSLRAQYTTPTTSAAASLTHAQFARTYLQRFLNNS